MTGLGPTKDIRAGVAPRKGGAKAIHEAILRSFSA